MDRRDFLRTAGTAGAAVTALAALPARRALADARPDPALAPFLHGVASGDPQPNRVILWTRVSDLSGPVEVDWVIARDPELIDVVASGSTIATSDRDHTVKVDAAGLASYTTYFYGFSAAGQRSLVGRTRTAPALGAGPDRLRMGLASCAKYDRGYFNAYARLAEADLDVVVHVGDYIYEEASGDDVPAGRGHEPAEEIHALAEYRARHAQYKLDPDLRRLHQQHPMVVTWDDHESANNAWIDGANRHDPAVDGPFSVRKAIAQQVYDEWMPIRLPVSGDPARIYRTVPYGGLVSLVMIDTRLEGRSEQVQGRANDGELFTADPRTGDPAQQMYSSTQRRFIEDSVRDSPAQWRLVGNQVLVSQLQLVGVPADVRRALAAIGIQDGRLPTEGANLATDIWDGYRAERDRLLGFLAGARVDNVVVLTGDIHTSFANDLLMDPQDPLEAPKAVEFVTPSVTSGNFDDIFGTPPRTTSLALEAAIRAQNRGTRWVELDSNGYVILDVTPERVQAEWWYVDSLDEGDTGQRFETAWQVRDGENRLREGSDIPTRARADRPQDAPSGPGGGGPAPVIPEVPAAALLPAAALGIAGAVLALRRRNDSPSLPALNDRPQPLP